MQETARKLIDKYGKEAEEKKICEELAELLEKVIKSTNGKDVSRMSILEERIDVELELHMIDEIYGFSDTAKEIMWDKKRKKIEDKYL